MSKLSTIRRPGASPAPVKRFPIAAVMETLRRTAAQWRSPIVTELANQRVDPFKILVSTILSLRTKDDCTAAAAARLFSLADTTEALARLDETAIARVIYPVGFYRTKAATIREISRRLLAEHGGRVPDSIDELLKFKGVGRKTANLVVTLGHGKPGICVDTHVHRITNRWGYVATRTPGETETALRARLPRRYWIPINDWLVAFGQHLCTPVSPHCSRCPLGRWCARRGVERSR